MEVFYQLVGLLYRATMFAGSLWCHQRPERSPHLFGAQLPLCWRCSGIAVGMSLLLVWLLLKKRLPPLALSLILLIWLPFDVLTAMWGLREGDNALRFATGLMWGAGLASVFLHLLARRWERRKGVEASGALAGRGRWAHFARGR